MSQPAEADTSCRGHWAHLQARWQISVMSAAGEAVGVLDEHVYGDVGRDKKPKKTLNSLNPELRQAGRHTLRGALRALAGALADLGDCPRRRRPLVCLTSRSTSTLGAIGTQKKPKLLDSYTLIPPAGSRHRPARTCRRAGRSR